MKRVNLTKYGFERTKEDDFSDDGNYCLKFHLYIFLVSGIIQTFKYPLAVIHETFIQI